jgi:hypothetical protein
VPASWTSCKRCATELGAPALAGAPGVPAPAGSGTGALAGAAPASPVTTASPGTPVAPAPARRPARAPVGPAARPAPPPPPPVPVTGAAFGVSEYQTNIKIGTGRGSAAPLLASPRRRRGRFAVVALLAVIAVAGWFAKDLVLAEPLPDALAAYVEGDGATRHRSDAGRFAVDLPPPVQETARTVDGAGGVAVVQATAVVGEAVLSVSYIDLPRGAHIDARLTLETGASGAAEALGGTVVSSEPATHQGYPALDATFEAPDGNGRVRLVLVDERLYAASVVGPYAGAPGFDRLIASLRIA